MCRSWHVSFFPLIISLFQEFTDDTGLASGQFFAHIRVQASGANTPPVAVSLNVTAQEDATVTVDLTELISDADEGKYFLNE